MDSAAQTGERTYIIHSDYTDDQYQIDWPEGYEIQQEEGDLIAIANMINSNTAIFYLEEKSLFTEDDMKAAIADSASYWKETRMLRISRPENFRPQSIMAERLYTM